MLKVESLTKTFPSRGGPPKTALDSVSFSVKDGSVLCLLGANGSGKTTLLKILAGLVLPDSGSVEIAGVRLSGDAREMQSVVGFSPGEERSFYGRLTGLENLRFFARLRGMDETLFRERLKQLDAALDIEAILPIVYQKTSSGMKQKLSLARACLHRPRLLLFDEPGKNLDPLSADALRRFVRRELDEHPDHLALWTTHQLDEAWEIGTEIAILSDGKLLCKGSPEELLKRSGTSTPKAAYAAFLRGHVPATTEKAA